MHQANRLPRNPSHPSSLSTTYPSLSQRQDSFLFRVKPVSWIALRVPSTTG